MRLFNTLSNAVETFAPENPPEVRMYVCGLTVYSRGHIGNYRTFVATDVLRRALKSLGYTVREVMNVTDVDDRIIQFAKERMWGAVKVSRSWPASFANWMMRSSTSVTFMTSRTV